MMRRALSRHWGWLTLSVTLAVLWLPAPAPAQSVRDVFLKVSPSVVVIKARGRDVTGPAGLTGFSETGSGVLVTADGKVMTAAHVVHAMDSVTVEFLGSSEAINAKVVASEPAADLSLLQLERLPKEAKVAPMADSNTVQVGDQVVIIGAPYGLSYSLSVGWISARWPPNTVYRTMPLAEFFQTDAVINTGNSGGPMFSMAGEVIGIVSHNISKSGGSEGLGFVVTLNTAKQLLLEKRSFWSGVEGQVLTDEQANLLNLPGRTLGFMVKTVAKDSPADKAGLRGGNKIATIDGQQLVVGGDILLSVAGVPIMSGADMAKIRDALNSLRPGDPFSAQVLRSGQVIELKGKIQ